MYKYIACTAVFHDLQLFIKFYDIQPTVVRNYNTDGDNELNHELKSFY